jgi:gliding motility-associated-like protein
MPFLFRILFFSLAISPLFTFGQAMNDAASAPEDTPVTFSVTSNDVDPDGIDPLTVDLDISTPGRQTVASNATQGTFQADDAGNVTFMPALNYNGTAIIQYSVANLLGADVGTADIEVTMTSVNDQPQAADDATVTNQGTPVTINILDNDADIDGTLDGSTVDFHPLILFVQSTNVTLEGTFVSDGSGNVTFTPLGLFTGVASTDYMVSDDGGELSNIATFTVTVNAVDFPPVANDDADNTNEDVAIAIDILSNDTDDNDVDESSVDLDPSIAGEQNSFSTTAGIFSVNSSGMLTFTPEPDYSGPATVNYTVDDDAGGTSNVASVTITVNSVNDPPVANDDVASTNENTDVSVNITSNDADVDGTVDPSSVDIDLGTAGAQSSITIAAGTFSVDNAGLVTFVPAAGFSGNAAIDYTIQDDDGGVSSNATLTITVNAVNDAPVAADDVASTNEDVSVTVNVLTNDSDDDDIDESSVDLDPSAAGVQTTFDAVGGTFVVNGSGTVTLTPDVNYFGTVIASYTVNDNEGVTSNPASITVNVADINDNPIGNDDSGTTNENTAVDVNVVSNDTDIDGTISAGTVDLNTSAGGIQDTRSTASGSYAVDGTGLVTFTPATNYVGTADLNYTVQDNDGATSNAATLSIVVTNVNTAPVAVADASSTNEDTPANVTILGNDSDDDDVVESSVDLDPLTPGQQTSFISAAGTFTVNGSGIVSFTPLADYSGSAVAHYTVDDNEGLTSNSVTITVTVNPVNDLPVASDDATNTAENTPVNVDVIQNDSDVDGTIDPTTVDLNLTSGGVQNTRTTTDGSYIVNASGIVAFTPTASFVGTAMLDYRVNDNSGATSNVATLSITVSNVNIAPTAADDATSTNEDVAVNISILANDVDDDDIVESSVDLDPSTAGEQTTYTATNGVFTVNGAGVVNFVPNANFNGASSAQYTVDDNEGLSSNVATITVTVNTVNDLPVANDDVETTSENTAVNVNVIQNDTDIDGAINGGTVDLNTATAGVQSTNTVAGGTFTANGSGVVSYTPTTNFVGTAVVDYRVNDNAGGVSNAATITVTVTNVNLAPISSNDNATTNEDNAVSINVLSNDNDDDDINASTVDLDPVAAGRQGTVSVTGGTFTVNASGVVNFVPTANFNGTSVASYTVEDNEAVDSNVATITVTVTSVNDAPVANNDTGTTNEATAVNVNVVANDTDVDGTINSSTVDLDPVTAGVQNSITTAEGSFSVNPSGIVTFTPITNFGGVAALSYNVSDNGGAISNNATISITVNSVNDAPVAANDVASTNEDSPVSFNILSNDADDGTIDPTSTDLDPVSAGRQNTLTIASGTFVVDNSGQVAFTPLANFNGSATASYVVEDETNLVSNTATITVTVVGINDSPVTANDGVATAEDTPITFNIVSNDADVDGTLDLLTIDLNGSVNGIQATRTVSGGTFAADNSGQVAFTPDANFNGSVAIQYTVQDNSGAPSNASTITVTVNPVNDPPVAVNDAATTAEGDPVTISILANDTDDLTINASTVDLDPAAGGIQSSLILAEGNASVNASGVFTYSPSANYNGTVLINYTVNDNGGLTSNTATITITVTSVNTSPVATNDEASTSEDTPVTILVTANDSDDVGIDENTVDLNTTTAGIQKNRSTTEGSWAADATGNVTFTPADNYTGTTALRYVVNDLENATSNPATITITVNPVNDKPLAVNDSRTTNEDTMVMINVLSNDTDADGSLLASSLDLDPSEAGTQSSLSNSAGTFSANATGIVTYVPANNFFGSATITYVVADNDGLVSDPATISVTVTSVNDAPIANNDIANTNQGQTISVNLVANDIDVDGTINVATVDLDPSTGGRQVTRTIASGTYTVTDAGVVTLVPVVSFSGNSTISYTVADNTGATSNVATISVLVNFVNQKPMANDDAATTAEDTPVTFNVVSNDTDDGSIHTSTVDLNPLVGGIQASLTTTEGSFTVNALGALTYTPSLNYTGSAIVNYTVNDNVGETSDVAAVTITVTPVNDSPVASNDATSTAEDTPVVIRAILNDSDPDGTIDPATVDIVPATSAIDRTLTVAQGTFTVNATNGEITFVPNANTVGTAAATYNVKDNLGAKSNTASVTVTITSVNDPPSFNVIADQRVLKNSAQLTITINGISAGAGESEQMLLTATSQNTTLIPHPSVVYNGTGATATLSFKPQLNQFGTAEITVKAVDGGLNEFSRNFVITVVDVSIISTPGMLAIPGESYVYNIVTTDIPETLSLVAVQKPAWANLTSTGKNTATLEGTPPSNASSTQVIIELRDGSTVIDEQQYELVINRRPLVASVPMESNEDVELLIGGEEIASAYSDADQHPLAEVQITALPKHGVLLVNGTVMSSPQLIPVAGLSTLTYRPSANYFGPDTVYFKVSDAYSYSLDDSYLNLTVLPVNDAPVIDVIESAPLVFDIGRELAQIFTREFNASDPDGDNITGATIGFRAPNFNSDNDLLEFVDTPEISGEYDDETGILELRGTATVAKYVEAIRTITYNFVDLQEITLEPRTVYVLISDGVADSGPKERTINLTYDFVELNIPNVFTPDNNGKNDLWRVTSETGLQQYNDAIIRVFDKRGIQVFQTVGFDTPWDGKSGGKDLPEDNYFYTIDLKYGKIKYTGTLLILRAQK